MMYIIILSLIIIKINSQYYYNSLVFDPHFYLNTYGDLLQHKIVDENSAKNHWLKNGIHEGRYGTSQFHVRTYFKYNKDVESSCNGDVLCGLNHYVTIGHTENRVTVESGVNGLYMLFSENKEICYATYTPRFASAIHSVMYKNKELVNGWDHGRELQYAITNGHGECFNPTEAGGAYDLLNPNTHSQLNNVNVTQYKSLFTSEWPAFWMAPGTSEKSCGEALNKEYVSKWLMQKTVEIKPFNDLLHVSRWSFSTIVPDNTSKLQIETPTLYANGDMNKIYTYEPVSKELIDITTQQKGETTIPIIIASEDGNYACGCYSSDHVFTKYAHFNFLNIRPWAASTSKWSIVYRVSNKVQGETVTTVTYVIVGSLQIVMGEMTVLSSKFG